MADDRPPMTSRGWRWPFLVAGLLGAQVALGAATAYLAVRDPAHSVTPGYHAKALAWEEQAKLQTASDALGWSAVANFKAGELEVQLRDRDGNPVRATLVEAVVFHHARGKDIAKLLLKSNEAGDYVAPFHAERAGMWEIRLTARRGADQFLWSETRDHSAEIVR